MRAGRADCRLAMTSNSPLSQCTAPSTGVDQQERRRQLAPGYAAGVDEAMIRAVVDTFYARVRLDDLLGPIFEQVLEGRWDAHLKKLYDFWSSVLLMTGRFKGAPMAVHVQLEEVAPMHFRRWLNLFRRTVEETCPPAAARLFIAKSEAIGQSLELGIAASRGELLATLVAPKG